MPGVEPPIHVAFARLIRTTDAQRVVLGNSFRDGHDEPDAGSQCFLHGGKRFQRRRHGNRRDGTRCQHCIAAVGEHRHASNFRLISACRRAANDVGAVAAHQRSMGAAHAPGDALHDHRRLARQRADHAGTRARNASSRSSVTNTSGCRSARMRLASAALRPTSRATTGTRN